MTEFPQRQGAVAEALAGRKVEALLVSSPASVRYLTGYAGSNGLVLIAEGAAHFFTDPRYATETKGLIDAQVHVCKGPLIDHAAKVLKRERLKRVGFEPGHMNVEQHERLRRALPPGYTLTAVSGVVEALRAVKSPGEIARIRRSVQVNAEAYMRTLRRVRLGARERDVAAELDYQMSVLGAEKSAFDTIVAVGERTALPHARPTDRRLGEDELMLVDMGATLDGYTSDMTRMSFTGSPRKPIKDLYKAVLEAQLAGIDAVRAGIPASRVDAAAREVLKRHELDKAFVHSTGHGLGLEIHEGPRIARKERTRLQAGMVITIEPGAYVAGLGGVRIEDAVLVTERGCEVLTPTSKEFIQL